MRFYKHFSAFSRVYLDFASSTPADDSIAKKVPKIPKRVLLANPSALHHEGVLLRRVLSEARTKVASVLEVHDDEIIFTSGATESDNLGILGSVYAFLKKGILHKEIFVFSSELEHSAVEETIKVASKFGVQQILLSTDSGVVNPKDIIIPKEAKAVIVSVMYVNNEIGTVQPIYEIAKHIRKLRKENPEVTFVFHTDATQAPAHFSLRVPSLGVDMMTLGATKLYCQKGVGILYKRRGVLIEPILHGGGQEFGLRPGTEPVELINNFSYSLEYAHAIREKETKRVEGLQKYFESQIEKNFPQLKITAKDKPRTPHITHIGVPNFDSELLVLELDALGVAVSAKSACKNEEGNESPIVEKIYGSASAQGFGETKKNYGAVRFSFGRQTTKKDLDKGISAIKSVFQKYNK